MKFEIKRSIVRNDNLDEWYWVLKGGNGEVMCTSEMLSSKQACKKSIRSIAMNCDPDTPVIDTTL